MRDSVSTRKRTVHTSREVKEAFPELGYLYPPYYPDLSPTSDFRLLPRLVKHCDMRAVYKDFSIFSSGGHLVQRSEAVLAILVEGNRRKISVKVYRAIGLGVNVV